MTTIWKLAIVLLCQAKTYIASDLGADTEVRVAGEHRIERGPSLFHFLLARSVRRPKIGNSS
jgi:hypothetical protein